MQRNKVIFLDIDGVLVTTRTFIANHGEQLFDPIAAGMLRRCCTKGVAIVISSTWRFYADMSGNSDCSTYNKLHNNLTLEGLLPYLHDDWKTVDLHRAGVVQIRGDEITEWLSRHPEVTHYAIIDDDVDMTLEQKRGHFIKTDAMNGFMYENYKSLAEILEVKPL
jgi:hypothetical protein